MPRLPGKMVMNNSPKKRKNSSSSFVVETYSFFRIPAMKCSKAKSNGLGFNNSGTWGTLSMLNDLKTTQIFYDLCVFVQKNPKESSI